MLDCNLTISFVVHYFKLLFNKKYKKEYTNRQKFAVMMLSAKSIMEVHNGNIK